MSGKSAMKWASAVSTETTTEDALKDVCAQISSELKGARPDVAFVFASREHRADYSRVPASIAKRLNPNHVLGCSGGGIIGAAREFERTPALSVTAAILPDVTVTPFYLDDETIPGPDDPPRRWEEVAGGRASNHPHFCVSPRPLPTH